MKTEYRHRWTQGWVKWAVVIGMMVMLITCALVAGVGIFQAKVAAGERERLVELAKREDLQMYFFRTQLRLDSAASRRFILAISQSPVKSQASRPNLDEKISVRISSGEELVYIYTIAPDTRYRDQYWVYYEKGQTELIEVARVRSAWLTHFLTERGLLADE